MNIRPSPLAPITWFTTSGAADATAEDDDFVAHTGDGYVLRVERMDRNSWWWQVYAPDGSQIVEDPWFMRSMDDAFVIAETVYLVHHGVKR